MLSKIFYNLSPLDQFMILPFQPFSFLYFFEISINNLLIMIILIFITAFLLIHTAYRSVYQYKRNFKPQVFHFLDTCVFTTELFYTAYRPKMFFTPKKFLFLIPSQHQAFLEYLVSIPLKITKENIEGPKKDSYVPLNVSLFLFLLIANMIGLIPFSYTITSQIFVGFVIASAIFIAINIIGITEHGSDMKMLFIPKGMENGNRILVVFLFIVELISYVFKPAALSIRLFANMMAGHTLMKVITGFTITLSTLGGILYNILQFIPLLVIFPLYYLETFVAFIQAYVFTSLISIYSHDCENLH